MLRLARKGLRFCSRRILVALLASSIASSQSLTNFLSGSKATPAAATADPLKRDSPRSAIYTFLKACHGDNYLLASQYLDLRNLQADDRSTSGPALAKTLCDFLDRDPNFEVSNLSAAVEGNVGDGMSPDLDVLDEIQADHKRISLYVERTKHQGSELWLVSPDTVAKIPQLAELRKESAIERHIPEPLVRIEWIDTPLWIWIALFLLVVVLRYVSGLLGRGLIFILSPLVKRYFKALNSYRLENFSEPIRLLLSLAVFRACMTVVPPSALLRVYLLNLIMLLVAFGTSSLLMRIVDLLSDRVITRLNPRERTISYSVAPLLVRFIKICIFCLAILFVLAAWGYNTTTILAGVGVGGLAVALAAQKTIENLFGGISLISDRAVLVGDFCQFGGQVGTIEDIGLRSTRIRTLDRTLVTIPNSQFSTMTLENYSRRDRMWFHPAVHLHRETSAEQVREMMAAIERILYADPSVDPTDVPTRFTKITHDAYVIEVFAYVLTPDYNEFLKMQSKLLLQMMEAATGLDIVFAVPVQEMLPSHVSSPQVSSPVRAQDVEVNV
ncbi:MAG TPA: mechanosensitive ion channel domain-containing protein [Bryobacteraceae bacterium]|nr:mechanosensitive ion channel domain-containing protein [Bryobacteraceae bacterium]